MIQIRSNVFESNSSSTHSICISKKPAPLGNFCSFHLGKFGWEFDKVDIRDYLYTAIMCMSNSDELLDKLKGILDKNGIRYEFEVPSCNKYGLPEFYIDHRSDAYDFVSAVLNDEDMLMRLLFNDDSAVYTGNDNVWGDEDEDDVLMCNVADEYRYCYVSGNRVRKKVGNWNNKYYDPDNFDYFYK